MMEGIAVLFVIFVHSSSASVDNAQFHVIKDCEPESSSFLLMVLVSIIIAYFLLKVVLFSIHWYSKSVQRKQVQEVHVPNVHVQKQYQSKVEQKEPKQHGYNDHYYDEVRGPNAQQPQEEHIYNNPYEFDQKPRQEVSKFFSPQGKMSTVGAGGNGIQSGTGMHEYMDMTPRKKLQREDDAGYMVPKELRALEKMLSVDADGYTKMGPGHAAK